MSQHVVNNFGNSLTRSVQLLESLQAVEVLDSVPFQSANDDRFIFVGQQSEDVLQDTPHDAGYVTTSQQLKMFLRRADEDARDAVSDSEAHVAVVDVEFGQLPVYFGQRPLLVLPVRVVVVHERQRSELRDDDVLLQRLLQLSVSDCYVLNNAERRKDVTRG